MLRKINSNTPQYINEGFRPLDAFLADIYREHIDTNPYVAALLADLSTVTHKGLKNIYDLNSPDAIERMIPPRNPHYRAAAELISFDNGFERLAASIKAAGEVDEPVSYQHALSRKSILLNPDDFAVDDTSAQPLVVSREGQHKLTTYLTAIGKTKPDSRQFAHARKHITDLKEQKTERRADRDEIAGATLAAFSEARGGARSLASVLDLSGYMFKVKKAIAQSIKQKYDMNLSRNSSSFRYNGVVELNTDDFLWVEKKGLYVAGDSAANLEHYFTGRQAEAAPTPSDSVTGRINKRSR